MGNASSYKYAKALADLGRETGTLPQLADAFRSFMAAADSDENLRELLLEKRFDRQRKKQVLSRLSGLEAFNRFLSVIIDNGREKDLWSIARIFADLSDAMRGKVRVEVRTAKKLADGQREDIINGLRKKLGNDVILSNTLDESLIGGAVYVIGDKVIDFSIAGSLQRLGKELSAC